MPQHSFGFPNGPKDERGGLGSVKGQVNCSLLCTCKSRVSRSAPGSGDRTSRCGNQPRGLSTRREGRIATQQKLSRAGALSQGQETPISVVCMAVLARLTQTIRLSVVLALALGSSEIAGLVSSVKSAQFC